MSICPFCKAQVASSHGPCPGCGKLASEHPSVSAVGGRTISDDFDDAEGGGDLDLGGGSVGSHGGGSETGYDGGMEFDDDLMGDGPQAGDLELDVPGKPSGAQRVPEVEPPQSKAGAAARVSGAHPAGAISGSQPAAVRPPTSSQRLPAAPSSGDIPPAPPSDPAGPGFGEGAPEVAAPPPREVDAAAAKVAKFPEPPNEIWKTPAYACKVLLRKLELRQDLESLRRRRSPDVALYERALQAHDQRQFVIGMAIVCTALAIATVLFFMPVILRFANAPD